MVSNYPQKQKLPHQQLPTHPALEGGVSIILWTDRSTLTYFVRQFFFLTHNTSKKVTLPTQNLALFNSFPIQSIAYLATWWTYHMVSHIKGESHNADALAQQSVGSIHLIGYTLKNGRPVSQYSIFHISLNMCCQFLGHFIHSSNPKGTVLSNIFASQPSCNLANILSFGMEHVLILSLDTLHRHQFQNWLWIRWIGPMTV